MVGKKGLFELKNCTVSGLKRQFDKWHLFNAPTGIWVNFRWARNLHHERERKILAACCVRKGRSLSLTAVVVL